VGDFSSGAPDANTYIAQTNDGEVMLAPTVGAEFTGSTLPPSWFGTPWATGGSATVSGGLLTVDGALAGTNTYYSPGHSLEFVATFGANTSQHVGFGTDLNAAPWAIFSTGYPGGTTLLARTYNGSTSTNTNLGAYLGAPHRYRIDWTASNVVYYIDGVQVASHAIAIAANMRPVASDQPSGLTLSVDWLRLSPYAVTGVFVSRLLDASTSVHWLNLTSLGSQPAGTSLTFETRTGNSTNPNDGTWSAWTSVTGTTISSPDSRYLQYRITLGSADTTNSPAVEQVTITYQLFSAPTPTSTPLGPTATNTPTPTATPSNTGLLSPFANASVTSSAGDNNGFEVSPTDAYTNDGVFAVDNNSGTNTSTSCTNTGKDKHLFYNFNMNLLGTATTQGLEVRLDGKADSSNGSPAFCVQLSWNGGASWTSPKSTVTLGTTEQTFVLGSGTDNWGHTWLPSELSNTNFRLRVIAVASSTARDFSLDWVAVRVTYR
jgi:hypothetical protein